MLDKGMQIKFITFTDNIKKMNVFYDMKCDELRTIGSTMLVK